MSAVQNDPDDALMVGELPTLYKLMWWHTWVSVSARTSRLNECLSCRLLTVNIIGCAKTISVGAEVSCSYLTTRWQHSHICKPENISSNRELSTAASIFFVLFLRHGYFKSRVEVRTTLAGDADPCRETHCEAAGEHL